MDPSPSPAANGSFLDVKAFFRVLCTLSTHWSTRVCGICGLKVFYSAEVGALLNNLAQNLLFTRGKRFGNRFSHIIIIFMRTVLHKLSYAHLYLHHMTLHTTPWIVQESSISLLSEFLVLVFALLKYIQFSYYG